MEEIPVAGRANKASDEMFSYLNKEIDRPLPTFPPSITHPPNNPLIWIYVANKYLGNHSENDRITFRRLGDEIDCPRFGTKMLATAINPNVHTLHFVLGLLEF